MLTTEDVGALLLREHSDVSNDAIRLKTNPFVCRLDGLVQCHINEAACPALSTLILTSLDHEHRELKSEPLVRITCTRTLPASAMALAVPSSMPEYSLSCTE